MKVKVEGGDEFSNTNYEKVCLNIFRDIGLKSNIDQAYLYCNAAEHVFIISVKIGRVPSPVKVRDVTLRGDDKLKITDEKYAPKLLALLWDRYGERVQQISRLEIGFKLKDDEEAEELMNLIVYEPREDLTSRILDGIDRILPEGTRVRYPLPSPDRITIIASENPIEEGWKEKAKKMVSEKVTSEGGA